MPFTQNTRQKVNTTDSVAQKCKPVVPLSLPAPTEDTKPPSQPSEIKSQWKKYLLQVHNFICIPVIYVSDPKFMIMVLIILCNALQFLFCPLSSPSV